MALPSPLFCSEACEGPDLSDQKMIVTMTGTTAYNLSGYVLPEYNIKPRGNYGHTHRTRLRLEAFYYCDPGAFVS